MPLIAKVVSADVLTEVMSTLGIQGRLFCRSELSAPWSLSLSPTGFAHFHVVERGEAWMRSEGESTAIPLGSGDLIIVPHGGGHVLCDHPQTPPVPLDRVLPGHPAEHPVLRHGGGGAETQLICGSFLFENAVESPLLSLLPPLIHIRGSDSEPEDWLASTLRLLAFEARQARPGAKTVISRLTEIIFVQAVRAWMENQPAGQRGWLGALRDPQTGAALGLIHHAPERRWSVAALARETESAQERWRFSLSGLSKAVFSSA